MPAITFSQALTANQRGYNPLANWRFRYNPYPRAAVRILINQTTAATANAVNHQTTIGTTIVTEGPLTGGGTAGVLPSTLNTTALEFFSEAGDLIEMNINELLGATPTVNGIVAIDPV